MSNLARAFEQATEGDLEFGRYAYAMYNEAMRAFSSFYGTGFVPTVEAFVALSPNNAYHTNLRSLAAVQLATVAEVPLSALSVSTYRSCALRAYSYLTGEVSFADTVKGYKITAFRDNILYPEKSKRVTVDGHMISLWLGEDLTMREAALRLRGLYPRIEADFTALARRVKLAPCQLQATLWAGRKRQRAIVYNSQLELFSGGDRWGEIPNPIDYPPFQIYLWQSWLKGRGNVQTT